MADTFVQQRRNSGSDYRHADDGRLAVLEGHGRDATKKGSFAECHHNPLPASTR
jgi:hypothetical protein